MNQEVEDGNELICLVEYFKYSLFVISNCIVLYLKYHFV